MNKTIVRNVFILFLIAFVLVTCSKEEINVDNNTASSEDNVIVQNEDKAIEGETDLNEEELDLSKEIIGEWYVITGEYANQVISFLEDGTYTEVNDLVDKTETTKGTYKINDGKLIINSKYSDDEMDIQIYNNVLSLSSLGFLYCKMGESFDPRCKGFNSLEGYYKDENNNYYHFKGDGELIVNGETLYYYVANKNSFIAMIPAGAATGMLEGKIEQDLDGNNELKVNARQYDEPYSIIEMPLIKIYEGEYNRVVGQEKEFHVLLVTADTLKVRKAPSTSSEKIQLYFRGRLIVQDYPFEIVEAEGYKWYGFGYGYIADKDGEWVKILK